MIWKNINERDLQTKISKNNLVILTGILSDHLSLYYSSYKPILNVY